MCGEGSVATYALKSTQTHSSRVGVLDISFSTGPTMPYNKKSAAYLPLVLENSTSDGNRFLPCMDKMTQVWHQS